MQALPQGTRVRHPRYGIGQIIESDTNHTLVSFETHGFMRFNTCYLDLTVIRNPEGHSASQTEPLEQ